MAPGTRQRRHATATPFTSRTEPLVGERKMPRHLLDARGRGGRHDWKVRPPCPWSVWGGQSLGGLGMQINLHDNSSAPTTNNTAMHPTHPITCTSAEETEMEGDGCLDCRRASHNVCGLSSGPGLDWPRLATLYRARYSGRIGRRDPALSCSGAGRSRAGRRPMERARGI